MTAKEYLELCRMTCQFHVYEPGMGIPRDRLCGQPAVAVYVTDDDRHLGTFVCQSCAEKVERDGDGPVFWQLIAKQPGQGAYPSGELRILPAD